MRLNRIITGKYSPFELNSILFDPRGGYEAMAKHFWGSGSYVYSLFVVGYEIIRQLAKVLYKTPFKCHFKKWDYLDNKLIFYVPTINNRRAVNNVINELSYKENLIVIDNSNDYQYFNYLYIWLISFIFIPKLLFNIWGLSRRERRIVNSYMHYFVFASGYTSFYFRSFSRYRPESVVLANDHGFDKKSMALVCEELDIITVYIQHASVTEAFPELHFSFSFLDGKDSVEKYSCAGKSFYGQVVSLGSVRYDDLNLNRINRSKFKRNVIGIAFNELDSNSIINELCNYLLKTFPDLKIKIRSHPALKNHPFVFDNNERLIYTCAVDESVSSFLLSIDLLFAGDSGILLDSIIGGVDSYAVNCSEGGFADYYGYVRRGLVRYLSSNSQIENEIRSFYHNMTRISVDSNVVRIYDESFKKKYSGGCSKIIADLIKNDYNFDRLIDKYKMTKDIINGSAYYYIPD